MKKRPFKIAITGTHSTGKSTFLDQIALRFGSLNLVVERFGSIAVVARGLGFPILRDHTIDSTLWIMAECMRKEAEATLHADVILIDRPVSDALGYLEAALEVTGRSVDPQRLATLQSIARAYTSEYDVLIETVLDAEVPLGPGRDSDPDLRAVAASCISRFVAESKQKHLRLTSSNQQEILEEVFKHAGCEALAASGVPPFGLLPV